MLGSGKIALAAVALGALALAGCGSSATSDTAKTEATSSVLALLRSDAKGSLQKAGEKSGDAKSVVISMQGTTAGKKFQAKGAVALSTPVTAQLTMDDPEDGPTEVRMLGTVIYVQVPAKDRADLDGKTWMKMDLGKDSKNTGEFARQFDDVDPRKQVKTMIDSGALSVVGEETVAGVKTVHYASTAPMSTYLAQLDPATRPEAEKAMSAQGIKEVKTDLWVDEQYLMRRSHVVLGDTDMTTDYSDYGKPVTVTEPPAAEVFDMAEMLSKLGSGLTG
ncbi:hypothetical protein ACNTMW_15040 [Planosporangium sp. 12N6]|uniref:hypothetical protein n=1 Tax=Planosporangium spinosum TaxID=3402278 RepID=UPI003CF5484E